MSRLAFVDTETLGLDPDLHCIWEVGLILRDPDGVEADSEHLWQIRLLQSEIERGDPVGMKIGRFSERYDWQTATEAPQFCAEFAELTAGCHLVGAVVSFDEERLRRMLQSHGVEHRWHYHLVDVECLAVGALAARGMKVPLPWRSDGLTAALGVAPVADEARHTALGDARWAVDIYDAAVRPVS